MKPAPIIIPNLNSRTDVYTSLSAKGESFVIHEWQGSGPDCLHVHHADDEAWHVLEGTLLFRFMDKTIKAPAGTTVFAPAGVPHTYSVLEEPTRYLIVLTPKLEKLIHALHSAPSEKHREIMLQFDSEMLE